MAFDKSTTERNPSSSVVVANRLELVSILVPCLGQLEYTSLLVPRILKHTSLPFELIFVDAGSFDGTAEYLAGLAAATSIRIETVTTPTEQGFDEAVQEAMTRAEGEYIVLLSNDTLVTSDWLDQLTALARSSPTIGMVGPVSNYATPPQLVEESLPYHLSLMRAISKSNKGAAHSSDILNSSGVDEFAHTWREQNRGKWMEVPRLDGFCLLIKRQVFQRVGALKSFPGLALLNTEEYCLRSMEAGFRLACCRDLFIHNFGSRLGIFT